MAARRAKCRVVFHDGRISIWLIDYRKLMGRVHGLKYSMFYTLISKYMEPIVHLHVTNTWTIGSTY